MKRLFLAVLLLFPLTLHAQVRTYTLVEIASDPGEGHKSGNEFSRMMGDVLKATYPSRVRICEVKLRTFTGPSCKAAECFRFTWSCEVEKSDPLVADYYFDHRGTLFSGATPTAAIDAVDNELRISQKVKKAQTAFYLQYHSVVAIDEGPTITGPDKNGRYWYLKEFFIHSGKRK